MTETLPKVVKVIDDYRVVINRGRRDGVEIGDRFLVYEVGEELADPDTNESLGKLEIVKGRGQAKHVQERLTTLESLESERVARQNPFSVTFGTEYETRQLPFNFPAVGDVARPLKKPGT
jgi:hypothetical protein